MTVLEKIKRCVSLVWDFQEIYGEEDIEEFCHNELHTYPQHDEIMKYFKHIEELEKENTGLKEELNYAETHCLFHSDCPVQKENEDQLSKSKEIIKKIEKVFYSGEDSLKRLSEISDILKEAENFIKEE